MFIINFLNCFTVTYRMQPPGYNCQVRWKQKWFLFWCGRKVSVADGASDKLFESHFTFRNTKKKSFHRRESDTMILSE